MDTGNQVQVIRANWQSLEIGIPRQPDQTCQPQGDVYVFSALNTYIRKVASGLSIHAVTLLNPFSRTRNARSSQDAAFS